MARPRFNDKIEEIEARLRREQLGDEEDDLIWVVELPWTKIWVEDYEHAFQHATGETTKEWHFDKEQDGSEGKITVMSGRSDAC